MHVRTYILARLPRPTVDSEPGGKWLIPLPTALDKRSRAAATLAIAAPQPQATTLARAAHGETRDASVEQQKSEYELRGRLASFSRKKNNPTPQDLSPPRQPNARNALREPREFREPAVDRGPRQTAQTTASAERLGTSGGHPMAATAGIHCRNQRRSYKILLQISRINASPMLSHSPVEGNVRITHWR